MMKNEVVCMNLKNFNQKILMKKYLTMKDVIGTKIN